MSSSSSTVTPDSFQRANLTFGKASTKVIGTHSGTFQADEALGVWLLRQTPTYFNSPVIRTRVSETLEKKCDIVIDVGGIYDHSKLRYDHHQRGYDERFPDKLSRNSNGEEEYTSRVTKLSASGLVYRHYGRDVISAYYPNLPPHFLELAYVQMYDSFMEAIDAIDTGVEILPNDAPVKLVYKDNTNLSLRVGRLNPRWNEEGSEVDPDARFETASAVCGQDFMSILVNVVESHLPAKAIVEEAILSRYTLHDSGEIIKFQRGGLPWKSHLYEIEKVHNIGITDEQKLIKFVLYADESGMWRIQAVTVEGQAFQNRLGLPESWRGVRDTDLSQIARIDGCTFCHASGFIGGNKTLEGAIQMACAALSQQKE